MNISPVTNSPSMKAGIFYYEGLPLFNRKLEFLHPENQKVSPEGIRYFEDTTVPENIKSRIEEIPLVKTLAKCKDVFVWFRTTTKPSFSHARIDVLYADYSKSRAAHHRVEGYADEYFNKGEIGKATDIAIQNLYNLRANRAITGELDFWEKIVEKAKKLRF